jgi:hypothetical protein
MGYSVPQYAWPPHFPSPCGFEDPVARRVAFNSDRIKSGSRTLDCKVQTESAAIVRTGQLPSLAAEEFFHGIVEPIAFGDGPTAFMSMFGHQTFKQRPA